jgi:hypothetical protein
MSSLRTVAFASALTITMGVAGLSPAKASTETWNFNSPTGLLPNTQNYLSTPGGFTATATGWLAGSCCTFTSPTALFGKNSGLDASGSLETGLGIANGPTGNLDNEITAGVSFIRIQLPTGVTNVVARLASITNGEHAEIFGSTSATSGYSLIAFNLTAQDTDIALVCPGCTFFAFTAVGTSAGQASDILIRSIRADVASVPLPGAIALFGTGLGLMGMLGLRRKRKQA